MFTRTYFLFIFVYLCIVVPVFACLTECVICDVVICYKLKRMNGLCECECESVYVCRASKNTIAVHRDAQDTSQFALTESLHSVVSNCTPAVAD